MGKLSSRREKFATNSLSGISQKFLAREWKLVNCFDYTFLNKWYPLKILSEIYYLFHGNAVIFTWHFLAQFSVYLVTSAQVLAVKAIDEGVAMVTLCSASAIWFVIYLMSEHLKIFY